MKQCIIPLLVTSCLISSYTQTTDREHEDQTKRAAAEEGDHYNYTIDGIRQDDNAIRVSTGKISLGNDTQSSVANLSYISEFIHAKYDEDEDSEQNDQEIDLRGVIDNLNDTDTFMLNETLLVYNFPNGLNGIEAVFNQNVTANPKSITNITTGDFNVTDDYGGSEEIGQSDEKSFKIRRNEQISANRSANQLDEANVETATMYSEVSSISISHSVVYIFLRQL